MVFSLKDKVFNFFLINFVKVNFDSKSNRYKIWESIICHDC